MRLFIRITFAVFVFAFVVIQFFQPKKNIAEITDNHIFKQEALPENVKQILNNACLDCHSNNTNYPWYNKIAPVSWMLSKHVTDGKKELNFSEWGELDTYGKIVALEDMRQEVEQKTMPIKGYVAMHKEAKLTEEQVAALFTWIDKKGEELVNSSVEE